MSEEYKIEKVQSESRGLLSREYRETVRDTEGKVAVGDWESNPSEASRSARERLSESEED
jgi:hypothetical protein